MDSDTMKGFVERLDEINTIADTAEGFVWRLQTQAGDATGIQAFNNPLLLVNMSVWNDVESLKNYVYRTNHVELIRDRDAWFSKTKKAHQALWWMPQGHIPSIEEGKQKLEQLQKSGPSEDVFTFARAFPMPEWNDNK